LLNRFPCNDALTYERRNFIEVIEKSFDPHAIKEYQVLAVKAAEES
jgi:hypothetical protein